MNDLQYPWYRRFVRVVPGQYNSVLKDKYPHLFTTVSRFKTSYRAQVVITTLGLALHFRKETARFSHILIDEGAQVREPELVGPLGLADDNTRIIIAGDHNQVGPKLLVFGEEANENGLGTSIMERLYKTYESLPDGGRSLHAELWTNYRCHDGLLMLPSFLFYDSTLVCRADPTTHPDASFPLVFVCSSLDERMKATLGRSDSETDCIIHQVKKYLENWPSGWEDVGKSSSVCIMSASEIQCRLIKKRLRKDKLLEEIDVLKAYDIQGRQYRAIFLSTVEATDDEGVPLNPTKTLCDRYVFNTAITRAQSLVVAVGNPFFLLRGEDKAGKIYKSYHNSKCWSNYMQRCLQSNSFEIYEAINRTEAVDEQVVQLKKLIYSRCNDRLASVEHLSGDQREGKRDFILEAYKSALESSKGFKNTKLRITRNQRNVLTWDIKDKDSSAEEPNITYTSPDDDQCQHYVDQYECVLQMQSYSQGEAIPLDSDKDVVIIRSFSNRKGAFDGDTVLVGVFVDNPEDKVYGRVITVLNRGSGDIHLCRVRTDASCLFPVHRKDPLLHNLPQITRRILQSRNISHVREHLESTSQSVAVFDEKSVEDFLNRRADIPVIRETISLADARDMLFLVRYVNWNLKYRSPLGAVIGALPKGHTLINAENLLRRQYVCNVDEASVSTSTPSQVQSGAEVNYTCFTIDPKDAVLLDDALSLKLVKPNTYELGVHIINVGEHVQPNSHLDTLVKQRGTSVYSGSCDKLAPIHMFPAAFREQLSLQPGNKHHCFTLKAIVNVEEETVSFVEDPSIVESIIESVIKMSYKSAQEVMDYTLADFAGRDVYEQRNSISVTSSLKILYKIAWHLRRQRLTNDSCYVYNTDPAEECCWQIHMLVEELMIFINRHVAIKLHRTFPQMALLRRQRDPNQQQKMQTIEDHQDVLQFSHTLAHLVSDDQAVQSGRHFLFPVFQAKQLLDCPSSNVLLQKLADVRSFPQLSVSDSLLRKSYARAEYCRSQVAPPTDEYKHYSLNLSDYTHFSSPLRRYTDIIVQRMLIALVQNKELTEFSGEEIDKLCVYLNKMSRNAKSFEKSISLVYLATNLKNSSQAFPGFVCKTNKGSFEVTFPCFELKDICREDRTFSLHQLGPNNKQQDSVSISLQVASVSEALGAAVLNWRGLNRVKPYTPQARAVPPDTLFKLWTLLDNCNLKITEYCADNVQNVVSIPSSEWLDCLKFIKDPSESNQACVRETAERIVNSASPAEKPPREHDSHGTCPFAQCQVRFNLKNYEMFRFWLTWSERDAFISPAIQLVELNPYTRVCIQHNSHPAECFSDAVLTNASKPKYSSIAQYVELWEKVLLAEASESSVHNSNNVILQDVHLDWPVLSRPTTNIEEKFYYPQANIKFTLPEHFFEQSSQFFKIHVGDLVCARYGVEERASTRAVFHLVVCDVQGEEISLKVVGKSNCKISEKVKSILMSRSTCELQVVTLSPSYQRVYAGLLNLLPIAKKGQRKKSTVRLRESSLIASEIACGKVTVKKIGSVKPADVAALSIRDRNALSLWKTGQTVHLNTWQEDAINKSSGSAFCLIQGPPGTGKSETGAHLAYIFAKLNQDGKGCVLYCGPSNKAVDVVLEKFHRLCEPQQVDRLRILRIYGKTTQWRDYPDPADRGKLDSRRDTGYKPEDWVRRYSLHHLIRDKPGSQIVKQERAFSELPEGEIPSGAALKLYEKMISDAEEKVLRSKYDVIFCTCNEAASSRVRQFVFPKQVIIDESGMATEPETIVPISTSEHVVVIGDHKQLQPVIDYPLAKDKGLSISLFQRYADYHEGFMLKLLTQYRMHAEICEFPSQHFYGGGLETDRSVKERRNHECRLRNFWPQGDKCPIAFCNVVGKEEGRETSSREGRKVALGSKSNKKDALKTVQIVSVLCHVYHVSQEQLAVLTPYASQEVLIRELADRAGLNRVTVTTIIKSQGDEYGFVVLSTVRSRPIKEIANPDHLQPDQSWLRENLGFVTDEHHINVGITRSKYGLIIVGNRLLLSYDSKTWKPLLDHYEYKHCIVNNDKFPTLRDISQLPVQVTRVVA